MTLGYFATYIDISLNLEYVNETNGKIKYDLTHNCFMTISLQSTWSLPRGTLPRVI